MSFKIIKSSEFKTISWTGGTSTELFIYPLNSDYKQGNFEFRLSTATVEVEKSNFTSLPGVSRKLMILDGEITITHENHYSKKLAKFDIDEFEGDWNTSSLGKCIDFNLMTRGNTRGEISALYIEKNRARTIRIDGKADHIILYAFSGEIFIQTNEETHRLNKGNLLVVTQFKNSTLQVSGITDCELLLSKITL